MNPRVKKVLMLLLAGALLFTSGQVQKSLNRDRDALGLTHAALLDNAPPVLAFTTVALGGFRGLISNFLWIRANNLELDDKFFEAAQLADWITKLEPTFPTVWVFQAWNMAYNISVKFKDFPDRWRWLENGIELLRDEGLRYNPNSVDIYRELGWFFQHKLGASVDDANVYYKSQWAGEMKNFFGPDGTNFDLLLNPPDAAARTNAALFRDKYKIDAAFARGGIVAPGMVGRWTGNTARLTGGCRRRMRFTGARAASRRRRKIPARRKPTTSSSCAASSTSPCCRHFATAASSWTRSPRFTRSARTST